MIKSLIPAQLNFDTTKIVAGTGLVNHSKTGFLS